MTVRVSSPRGTFFSQVCNSAIIYHRTVSCIVIFPVQLATCRIGNLARLINTLAMCVTMHCPRSYTLSKRGDSNIRVITVINVCVVIHFILDVCRTSGLGTYQPGSHKRKVTQDFSTYLPSAVLALIFLARRIQPFLSLVDREVEFFCTNESIVLHSSCFLFCFVFL